MKPILPHAVGAGVAALVAALITSSAPAAILGLPASDSGFYNAMGRSSKNDGVVLGAAPATFNYSAGAIDEVPPLLGPPFGGIDVPRKNYFTFDLGGISADIVAATLEVYLPDGGYGSPEPSEIYSLYGSLFPGGLEMTAFADELTAVNSILVAPTLLTAMGNYAKLTGTKGVFPSFGTVTLSEVDEDTLVSIDLTPTGLAYLNLFKGGFIVLSGELDTLNGVPGLDEFVFGYSAPLMPGVVVPDPEFPGVTPTPTLRLETSEVPEPGTVVAAGALLAVIASSRLRAVRRRA